jgi:Na+-translocating ferredoxin:NAD+ oxidoreductase RNF subunit RnfB
MILISALFALALAFILGLALGFFRQFFAVPQDPLVEQIREALPGANCGACGFPGCDGYAGAAARGEADINRCTVGGPETAQRLAALTGGTASVEAVAAILACRGLKDKAPLKGEYTGLKTCRGAKLSAGGTKLCAWGCIGYGDCVKVCRFGALSLGDEGVPVIDRAKCTGCKLCMAECPQALIRTLPRTSLQGKGRAIVLCSSRETRKGQVIKSCKAGCIKCEICVKNCPAQCISMDRGIPVVDHTKCSLCGTCAAKCPTKAFHLIQDRTA